MELYVNEGERIKAAQVRNLISQVQKYFMHFELYNSPMVNSLIREYNRSLPIYNILFLNLRYGSDFYVIFNNNGVPSTTYMTNFRLYLPCGIYSFMEEIGLTSEIITNLYKFPRDVTIVWGNSVWPHIVKNSYKIE